MQCIDLKLKRAAKHFWIDAAGRPMVSLVFETHLPLMSLTGRDAQLESPSCKKCKVPPRAARPSLGLKIPLSLSAWKQGDSGQMIGVRSMTGACCKSYAPEPPKPKPNRFSGSKLGEALGT